MSRIILPFVLALAACTGQEAFEDIVRAEPGEVTFSWDPAQPLTGEIDIPTVVRVTNTATETNRIAIPDVPGLTVEGVGLGGPGSQSYVFRDDDNSRWFAVVEDGFGFDLHVTVTECFEGTRTIPIEAESSDVATVSQTILLRVRNTFSAGDPPDPGPGPVGGISSDLAVVRAIEAIEDENGIAKIMIMGETAAGDGATEIRDAETGFLEHTLPTVNGRSGSASFTPDGKLIYTVIVDDASGFVRCDVFDAVTGGLHVTSDYNASQWIMGAAKSPFDPVRLGESIFTAPGAALEYQVMETKPGPVLDGEPTVQPWIPQDLVSDARRQIRGVAVCRDFFDCFTLNRNDGEADTVLACRPSGPGDNPANPFFPVGTVPGEVDRLFPFGTVALAWKDGDAQAQLLRRDASDELTILDGLVTLPASILGTATIPIPAGEDSRGWLLCPDGIEELTVPAGGPVTRRAIGIPDGPAPLEFEIVVVNGVPRAYVLNPVRIDVVDIDP